MNKLSTKEKNLVKGAIRRVFSRSELRKTVIDASVISNHVDTTRPRVKTWCKCAVCGVPNAKSSMAVDHIIPVIPLHLSLEDITLDELVNRIWCDISNLQSICEPCHKLKTSAEAAERRAYKKARKEKK